MGSSSHIRQTGLSLVGLIFVLIILGMLAVLGMKVVPSVIEYNGIKRAIQYAKSNGDTVQEIQRAFDRQAEVGYITSIKGRDLIITKTEGGYDVAFAYDQKIPLFAPASLLLEYNGTTARGGPAAAKKKGE